MERRSFLGGLTAASFGACWRILSLNQYDH